MPEEATKYLISVINSHYMRVLMCSLREKDMLLTMAGVFLIPSSMFMSYLRPTCSVTSSRLVF